MWIYNNNIIKTPKSMTIGDITYPAKIFQDSALLAELGITSYSENTVDNRYYWSGELSITDGVGTYAAIPRDVATLKENMVDTVKSQVGARLKPTDWMVIREADGGDAMNADVKAYRAAIRAEGNVKETEIAALADLNAVIVYENKPFTEVRKVKHTAEDGTETYGPETESHNREINMTMHFDAIDPLADVDPAFVSLTQV